ncbi:MAG TPA: class I SAM-dependent methyltransferase, partial [bacterium]|nr:class I SAM-dependent methyltransferase [bacterium]
MQQDDYRDLYKKMNKNWNDSVSLYKAEIAPLINKNMVVLEAGCGFSNLFTDQYEKAKKVIGVDISQEYLNANTTLEHKVLAPLEDMPQIPTGSIDLVVSSWVLEHIQNSQKAFSEISRVLKPGGKFVFLTPNEFNYVVIINKILPVTLRNKLSKKLTENLTVDPMPATYQANNVFKINILAKKNGLRKIKLILNGDPTYLAISRIFFYIGITFE